jgi:cytochrome c oxidase cbb3-type subunit I
VEEQALGYGTVKAFFISAMIWFVVGTSIGFIDATHLVAPELISNVPGLVFGRLRPMHTNVVIYGFAGAGLIGCAHYILPALMRTPLFSETLGQVSLLIYNGSILAGTILLGFGYNQGREYAEWTWGVDIGILTALLLIFINFFMTAMRRKEKILYVSAWYIFASTIFQFFIYFFGNAVWHPSTGAITGIPDAILAWFYGHGIVGLFLTPLAVAVAYYVVPIVCRTPLYSHTVSLIGFWSILVIYTHIGAHHLLQAPVPTWLKVVAITGSIAMFVPVLTVMVNLWLTMRGRLAYLHASLGGRFIMAGLVWYILVCIQGPLQSLPAVQRVTHFNNWEIGHAHIGVLGFAGFIAIGGIYFILPRITGRPIHNLRLADAQFWMVLLGITAFFVILTPAGLVQGNAWYNGEYIYRVLPEIHIYMVLRAATGLLIVAAAYIGVYIVLRNIIGIEGQRT